MKFLKEKICCIADLHIGVHQNNPIWHGISLDFANWLKAKLNEQGIKDIVIAGDIYNDRNEISVNTMDVANKIFNIWKEFNIVILIGNHDSYYKDRPDVNSLGMLSGWSNISVFDKITTTEQFDKTITFCPWATDFNHVPNSDIIFGHFSIAGFKMNKGKICTENEGIVSNSVLSRSNLIISGHFHLREERKYANGTILYLGSPYELTWGEIGDPKGIYTLDIISKKYEFIENVVSPKHKHIKLSELIAASGVSEEIKKDFPGNFISFIIDKTVDFDKIEILINKFGLLKPISITTEFELDNKFNSDDIAYEYTGIDMSGAIEEFINMLNVENKQEVLNSTLNLYRQVS